MSTLLNSLNRQTPSASAHPLFPQDQAFLWLPGFSGHALPFCSYNFRWDTEGGEAAKQQAAASQVPLCPAHPVSQETFIAWNTTVVPPFPYHPVPLVRPLSAEEIADLGNKVSDLCQETTVDGAHAVRSENKYAILTILARMGLLSAKPEKVSRVA